MWIPAIISTIVVIIAIAVLTYLQKSEKIKEDDEISEKIKNLGLCIPILVILANYAYAKTDTTKESMIVLLGLFTCFFIGMFIEKKSKKNEFSLLKLLISWIIGIAIILYIHNFMLDVNTIFVLSQFILFTIIAGEGKWKAYVLAFIVLFGVTFIIDQYDSIYFNNKVERTAINYVKAADYDFTDEDNIAIIVGSNRGERIVVWIFRSESQKLKRHLSLTYYEGSIIEFQDKNK